MLPYPLRHPRLWWRRQRLGYRYAREVSRDLLLHGASYRDAVRLGNRAAADRLRREKL